MQLQRLDLRRRRDIGAMVTLTFDFLRLNFPSLGRAILAIAGPPIAVLSVLAGVLFSDFFDLAAARDPYSPATPNFSGLMGTASATLVLWFVVTWILTAVINAYISIYDEKKGVGSIEVAEVRARFFRFLGMSVGTGIVLLVILFVSFFFFVIPAIYLSIALSMTLTARAVEGKGLFEGMSRSMKLVSGNWWMTLGLTLVMTILNSVVSWIFAIPQFALGALYEIIFGSQDPSAGGLHLATTILMTVQTFSSHLLNAVIVTALALHYFNLVEKKEHVGAKARLEEIGAGRHVEAF